MLFTNSLKAFCLSAPFLTSGSKGTSPILAACADIILPAFDILPILIPKSLAIDWASEYKLKAFLSPGLFFNVLDISINLLSKFDLKLFTLSGIGITLINSSGFAPPFALFIKS